VGTGFLALLFAELGHTVTGIDLAPRMLDRARQKAEQANRQVDFRVGNAIAVDESDETFDLVVARHLIWTLPVPEDGVSEWLRVLRRGGRLALIEGKWGHNDAMALGHAAPARSRLITLVDEGVALVSRGTRLNVRWFCGPRYRRLEAELPFSGGPPAERLTALLQAQQVIGVEAEPLMDPVLWGETPQFPRYLVSGTRPMS
jgi:SAM-dependent methyltransferase